MQVLSTIPTNFCLTKKCKQSTRWNNSNLLIISISCRLATCHQPAAPSVHFTTSSKHSLVLLRTGEISARNMLRWLKLSINCYCCIQLVVYIIVPICTVTQISNSVWLTQLTEADDISSYQNWNQLLLFCNTAAFILVKNYGHSVILKRTAWRHIPSN